MAVVVNFVGNRNNFLSINANLDPVKPGSTSPSAQNEHANDIHKFVLSN